MWYEKTRAVEDARSMESKEKKENTNTAAAEVFILSEEDPVGSY